MTKLIGRAFANFSTATDRSSEAASPRGGLVDNSIDGMFPYRRLVKTSRLRRLWCWAGFHDWSLTPNLDDFGKVHLTRRLCLRCASEDNLSKRFGSAGVCVTPTHHNRRAAAWLWNRYPVCSKCVERVPSGSMWKGEETTNRTPA